ncbi:MAG TPA: hypothetical protein VH306_02080 [Gaiellaceae bacterium]|jgi:hypothetical protein
MSVLVSSLLVAAEKSTAEEGKDVIIAMLLVGLVFVGVIVLGQTLRYFSHRRAARKRTRKAY